MKVLEINVYNYRRGGSEAVYFNTSSLLEKHGHQVVNFSLKWDDNLPCEYDRYFPESKDTRTGILRPAKNIITYFYHFEAARKLEALIEAEKPDVAQIHLIWGQLTPSILKVLKKHNIPAVLTVHDYRLVCPAFVFRNGEGKLCEECHGTDFTKCISNRCCKGSRGLSAMMAAEQYFRNAFFAPAKYLSGLIYVSDFARDIHNKYMPALKSLPYERLYNMSAEIDSVPRKEAALQNPYFLYFGRLSAEKGVPTLIEAFSGSKAKLKIVGTGPEEEALKKIVADRKLTNIEFLGYKTGKDLQDIVRGAYFVVVPSEWYENNPLTIIESYSYGTPVIGARIGGIPEIIVEDSTGFQFEAGSADNLREVISKASALSPGQYNSMVDKALDFARSNFDSEVYYNKLINFFEKLLKK